MQYLLTSPAACINLAENAIARYPHVKALLKPSDVLKWHEKLKDEDVQQYVLECRVFNLLTACVVEGLGLQYDFQDPGTRQSQRLLSKLDQYLALFPSLQIDKSFHGKICNLEQFNFLSTLNELSLAYYYAREGFQVTFEQRFTKLSKNLSKDVDLTLTDPKGKQFNLEVYMPTDEAEINGFITPTEGNHHFAYKVGKKALDKFGHMGISGLAGSVFVAINTALLPLWNIQKLFSPQSVLEIQKDIAVNLPSGINGLVQYVDDFGSEKSLSIQEIYLRA